MTIPLFVPKLPSTDELLPFFREIEKRRTYSNFGPMVNFLHSKLAEYFAVEPDQVTSLANATLALEGAMQTSSMVTSSWLSPSWTFAATNLALERNKMSYKFEDVDGDWRILTSDTTSALIDVCPFGDGLNLTRFNDSNRTILVDAAASFPALKNCGEALINNKGPVGIVVSFHPTKVLPGAEGGVFISNDKEWVAQVMAWSKFGMNPGSRTAMNIGTNAKMNEYQAAIILASIKKYETLEEEWLLIHKRAREVCEELRIATHPGMRKGHLSSYWIIESSQGFIDMIESKSSANHFQTRRWWEYGCHKMPMFQRVPFNSLINTERIAKCTIGLPFHLHMKEKDFETIYNFLYKLLL